MLRILLNFIPNIKIVANLFAQIRIEKLHANLQARKAIKKSYVRYTFILLLRKSF